MEPRANYFIVGLFVIALTAILVTGALWLSARQDKADDIYLVYLDESVSGLNEQAPVKFNGVNVGFVDTIQLNTKDPQQVILQLRLEKGLPIDQGTRATLMTQGITGVMFIGLKAGATPQPPLKKLPGQPYPIIQSDPSLLLEVSTAMREITSEMQGISAEFHKLLNPENQQSIRNTLMQLDSTTQNLVQQILPQMSETMRRFGQTLNDVEPLANTLKDDPSALLRGKAPAAPGPGE